MTRLGLQVFVAVTVLASACSSLTDLDGIAIAEPPVRLGMADEKDDSTPITKPGQATTTPTVSSPSTSLIALGHSDPPGSPTATTSGSGSGPSTTVDIMTQYRGVLGNLGLNQSLAAPAAAAPPAPIGMEPLTGWPGSPPGPAVVVKIDNSRRAMPQSGLELADIVIEEEVEWGITRFAAIYHSRQATVGPVRSGRSTDISFLSSLVEPALVYSGANKVFDTLLLRQERVQNYSAARNGNYWRNRSRRAPSNLYANTGDFNGSGATPVPWFEYRSPGQVPGGSEARSVSVTLGKTSVDWSWDGSRWLRSQNGSAHLTSGGAQLGATNLVVAVVSKVDSGLVDSAGGAVPEFVWAGTGAVSVFTDGHRVDGAWTRASLAEVAVLVDEAGDVIQLAPGNTWIELVTEGQYSSG